MVAVTGTGILQFIITLFSMVVSMLWDSQTMLTKKTAGPTTSRIGLGLGLYQSMSRIIWKSGSKMHQVAPSLYSSVVVSTAI